MDPKSIEQRIGKLRSLPDDERAKVTKELALLIRELPGGDVKLNLAAALSNLATEGDFGRDTLQAVTDTLARAVGEPHTEASDGRIPFPYTQLAALSRYEHMKVELDTPIYRAALAELDVLDAKRKAADFTLPDITGKSWNLTALKGKVVLVNFWATWCPPCRKEMPDLEALYNRFKGKGFVILGISDETMDKVQPFIAEHKYTFPILLDSGRKVNGAYGVDGIPKSFVYDRSGKLVAQSIDMRTQRQFLEMLVQAGLK